MAITLCICAAQNPELVGAHVTYPDAAEVAVYGLTLGTPSLFQGPGIDEYRVAYL
jgi:hypothetical protein